MKIVCDSCGTKYSIADEKVRGKVFKIRCKRCSHIIVVKGTSPEAEQGAAGQNFEEQKETRVFDYGEGEGGAAGAAAGAAAAMDAVWHLVIDREQVGPMSMADVQERWQRGEINKDTYGWREGMADWQRVSAISELQSITSDSASGDPAAGAAAASGAAPSADPADLFSQDPAPAGGGGDDLFARAGVAAGSESAAANGSNGSGASALGAAAGGGAMAAAGSSEDANIAAMTGQRNENSVLFSLNNLASAVTASSPAAANGGGASGGGGGAGAFGANTGGREGSGLIDIRAMAATTLGSGGAAGAPAVNATDDDLPVFNNPGFGAAASNVILPPSQGGTDKKLIYTIVGAAAVVLIVVVALVVVLMKDDAPQVQANNALAPEAAATPGATPPGEVAEKVPAVANDDNKEDDDAKDDEPEAKDEKEDPEPAAKDDDDDDKKPANTRRENKRDTRRDNKRDTKRDKPVKRDPKPEPKPEPRQQKCDEVECLVDDSMPCCKKYKRGNNTKPKSRDTGNSNLPAKLSRSDIKSGVGKVKGRVYRCNDKYGKSGIVKVRMVISGSGRVSSANTTGAFAGTPTGRCVESAIKKARFPKFSGASMTVSYPFAFK